MNAEKDTTSGTAHAPPVETPEPRRPKLPSKELLRKLTEDDAACLLKLIEEPTGYIDHPRLHRSGATKELFGVSARLQSGRSIEIASFIARPAACLDRDCVSRLTENTTTLFQANRLQTSTAVCILPELQRTRVSSAGVGLLVL